MAEMGRPGVGVCVGGGVFEGGQPLSGFNSLGIFSVVKV